MPDQLDYKAIKEIFRRFQESEPEPKGELDHVNAFTLVVAVALSAQSTDIGVNKATRELFKIADTPEKMLALGEASLIEHIKTIGLFRNVPRTGGFMWTAKVRYAKSQVHFALMSVGGDVPRIA